MPDISKCTDINCPLSKKCYRFTSLPSKYMQTYFSSSPFGEDKKDNCRYFWDNKTYQNDQRKETT